MEIRTSVRLKYWIPTDTPDNFPDLIGIHDFRQELSAEYDSDVEGKPSSAGGLVFIDIHIVSQVLLTYALQLVRDGIAFDLIKYGAIRFVLQPLITAYKRLRRNNPDRSLTIGDLHLQFQDSSLVIHETFEGSAIDLLGRIITELAAHYDRLSLRDGGRPSQIHIPLFEDSDSTCRFRVTGHMGETIYSDDLEDYFHYWGLLYPDNNERRVYDVRRQLLIDATFCTLEEYYVQRYDRA